MNITLLALIDLIPKSLLVSPQKHHNILETHITSVITDTRNIVGQNAAQTVFIALTGDTYDGNAFIEDAYSKGILVCIGNTPETNINLKSGTVYIEVTNTLEALQQIAKNYREQYLSHIHIIGVTGSVGKTSVKDMLTIACKLIQEKPESVSSTQGNLNNHIGVPLSILSIPISTQVAILEAGMNHRGEIQMLAHIMQPQSVVITKIGVAHIEYLGSKEEIAREKSDLALYSPRATDVYIPDTDEYSAFIASYIKEKSERLIKVHQVNIFLHHDLEKTLLHIISNISLVLAVVSQLYSIDMKSETASHFIHTLLNTAITPRRFEVKEIAKGITLVDDSYNANPDSMRASLKAFDDICAEKIKTGLFQKSIVILGGMAELGEQSERFHQETCAYIQSLKHIDTVISVGDLAKQYAFPEHILHCDDIHIAYEKIIKSISISDTDSTYIFIKGSKSTHMSDLADMLTKYFKNTVK